MEKGLPRVSTSLLVASRSSEASEESDVDEGEARGVSAGEIVAEDATLLEAVEAGTRCTAAVCGNAVVDMMEEILMFL
jgi:hypothetical protein